MNQFTKAALAGCAFTLIASTTATASVLAFTDRSAWEAAVGGAFSEEDFEAFQSGVSYEFTPLDVGDFVVSVGGDTYGFHFHNVGPSTANDVNGTSQINAATGYEGGTTISFDHELIAFGADWQGVSNHRTTSLGVNGLLVELPPLHGSFFGVVATQGFSAARLILTSGAPDGFGIDNVVYSRAPVAMAEADSFALVALGVGMLGWSRRRRPG